MMGATFPTLVRHFTRWSEMGHAFGRLYMANTLGAVAGTAISGLVLIELFGLSGALRIGAACSAVAGLVALWLAREGRSRRGPCLAGHSRGCRSSWRSCPA
jgi:spermidine synthase